MGWVLRRDLVGWKVGLFGFAAVRNPLHMEPLRVLVAGSDARVRFAVIPYAFPTPYYPRNSMLGRLWVLYIWAISPPISGASSQA